MDKYFLKQKFDNKTIFGSKRIFSPPKKVQERVGGTVGINMKYRFMMFSFGGRPRILLLNPVNHKRGEP